MTTVPRVAPAALLLFFLPLFLFAAATARSQEVVEASHLRSYGPGDTLVVSRVLALDEHEGRTVTRVVLTYSTRDRGLSLAWVWNGRVLQTVQLSPGLARTIECRLDRPWAKGALHARIEGKGGGVRITHLRAEMGRAAAGGVVRPPVVLPPPGRPPVATVPGSPPVGAPPLIVKSFSPARTAWGASVLLELSTARDLVAARGTLAAEFGGVRGTVENVYATNPARTWRLAVRIPSGAPSGPVTVHAYGQRATSRDSLTIFGSPTITAFAPARLRVLDELVITGAQFVTTGPGEGTTVEFPVPGGGSRDASPEAVTEREVRVKVPAEAQSGVFAVRTVIAGQGFSAKSPLRLVVLPRISAVPQQARVAELIRVSGAGLPCAPAPELSFGGAVAPAGSCSGTSLEVKVPQGARSGPLTLKTPDGDLELVKAFRVLTLPAIRSITPQRGPLGTEIVIEGEDLDRLVEAKLEADDLNDLRPCANERAAVAIVSKERTRATLRLPTTGVGSPGPAAIGARTADYEWSNNVLFTLTPEGMTLRTPRVDRLRYAGSPPRVSAGSTVIIETSNVNFNAAQDLAVEFAGHGAAIQDVRCGLGWNTAVVTATVPAVSATGKVRLTSFGLASGESTFDVEVYGPPQITAIEPSTAKPGDVVTIRGNDFVAQTDNTALRTRILFAGASGGLVGFDPMLPADRQQIVSLTRTAIQVRVPEYAATGPVTLETTIFDKTFSTQSAIILTVVRAPSTSRRRRTAGSSCTSPRR